MIARTAKCVFLDQLSKRCLTKKDFQTSYQIVDFLNLIFGASDETGHFYNTVLYPRASDYYEVSIEDLEALELQPITLY